MVSCVGKTRGRRTGLAPLPGTPRQNRRRSAEICEPLVDPRARNNGLYKFMLRHLANMGQQIRTCTDIYTKATTDDSLYAAGRVLSVGARETCHPTQLPAGYAAVAAGLRHARPRGEKKAGPRQSTMWCTIYMSACTKGPERLVFVPQRHTQGHRRKSTSGKPVWSASSLRPKNYPKALADYSVNSKLRGKPDWQESHIRVHEVGRDFTTIIRHHLAQRRLKKDFKSIIADLPLSDSRCAPQQSEVLERMGFFFAGIIPEKDRRRCAASAVHS